MGKTYLFYLPFDHERTHTTNTDQQAQPKKNGSRDSKAND